MAEAVAAAAAAAAVAARRRRRRRPRARPDRYARLVMVVQVFYDERSLESV